MVRDPKRKDFATTTGVNVYEHSDWIKQVQKISHLIKIWSFFVLYVNALQESGIELVKTMAASRGSQLNPALGCAIKILLWWITNSVFELNIP